MPSSSSVDAVVQENVKKLKEDIAVVTEMLSKAEAANFRWMEMYAQQANDLKLERIRAQQLSEELLSLLPSTPDGLVQQLS